MCLRLRERGGEITKKIQSIFYFIILYFVSITVFYMQACVLVVYETTVG